MPSVSYRTTLQKLEVRTCGNLQKNLKIVSHLTKIETSLVTWLNIVIIVVRSVRLLPAHMREDVHNIRQLHCQRRSGQCHAKHAANAASVHRCCAPAGRNCYLQRIFNRNRKLKQQVT